MDGKTLLLLLRQLLGEPADSGNLSDYLSYRWLNEAAVAWVDRTHALRSSQSITTVADQTGYSLDANFMRPYLRDDNRAFYIKYNDGSNNTFPFWKPYEVVIREDSTTSQSVPGNFVIIDDALDSQQSGAVDATSASSGGQSTLSDGTADFTEINVGDTCHNTADGSVGVVLSKTSTTALVTALFEGTNNAWTNADTYVIQPQGRLKIILDPPPSTAGHTVTVHYLQRPAPVYSDYGVFRFQSQFASSLVKYAAWMYKYRDREPDFADELYKFFDAEARAAKANLDNVFGRTTLSISFKK